MNTRGGFSTLLRNGLKQSGRQPELEQIVGSIELTIYAVVYGRTRINDDFQEYRIMKRLLIFRIHHSR